MEIDVTCLRAGDLYRILTGSILPRPIAWVSTVSAAGVANLAPFSFFTVASVVPPVLCFSPMVGEVRGVKDTLANICETGEFVVNVVSCSLAAQMNQTSAAYPGSVSEFAAAGLATQPSAVIRPPGVRDSLVRFECVLRQLLPFGDEPFSGNLVLGDVRHIYLHPEIYRDGKVDFAGIDAVGRLAGNFYATTRDRFQMARPVIKPGE